MNEERSTVLNSGETNDSPDNTDNKNCSLVDLDISTDDRTISMPSEIKPDKSDSINGSKELNQGIDSFISTDFCILDIIYIILIYCII